MDDSRFEQALREIAADSQAILYGHIQISGHTHCILLAHACKSTLFYRDFVNVTRATFAVNRASHKALKQMKRLIQAQGAQRVWTKGVFSIYGDLRPLAEKAGFGVWGDNGLIVHDKYGSDFLISALFFR